MARGKSDLMECCIVNIHLDHYKVRPDTHIGAEHQTRQENIKSTCSIKRIQHTMDTTRKNTRKALRKVWYAPIST